MGRKVGVETEISPGRLIPEAIRIVRNFVAETTGQAPSDEELADALKRYFVLNEIKEHVLMARRG